MPPGEEEDDDDDECPCCSSSSPSPPPATLLSSPPFLLLLLPRTNPLSSTASPHCSTANCRAALGRYLSGSVTHSSLRVSSAPRTRKAHRDPIRASLATAAAETKAAPSPASTAPLIASTELTSSTTGRDLQSRPAASSLVWMAWTGAKGAPRRRSSRTWRRRGLFRCCRFRCWKLSPFLPPPGPLAPWRLASPPRAPGAG